MAAAYSAPEDLGCADFPILPKMENEDGPALHDLVTNCTSEPTNKVPDIAEAQPRMDTETTDTHLPQLHPCNGSSSKNNTADTTICPHGEQMQTKQNTNDSVWQLPREAPANAALVSLDCDFSCGRCVGVQTDPSYEIIQDRDIYRAKCEIKRVMRACSDTLVKWALPNKLDAATQTSDPIIVSVEAGETRVAAIEREISFLQMVFNNKEIAESLLLIKNMLDMWPASRRLYNVRVYQPGELPTDSIKVELCRTTNINRKKGFKTRHVYTYPIKVADYSVTINEYHHADDARGPFMATASAIFDNPFSATHSLFVEITRVICDKVTKERGIVNSIVYKIYTRSATVCNTTVEQNFLPMEYKHSNDPERRSTLRV
jgi:hypothetical protein